ncbi:glycerotoxin paralog 1-like [Tubulanus polymorphus]|uniref:glycerotoxin paralog 1-like n=1 Tax=Tubulanus polymorphus TaxID=672921 RepID=UPI003DA58F00
MADMDQLDILSVMSGIFANTEEIGPAIIVNGYANMANVVKDVLEMEEIINRIIQVSSSYETGVEGNTVESIYDSRTVGDTARLKVQIGKWQALKALIEQRLEAMIIPDIAPFINEVKASLIEMTVWGEALTKEAINIGVRVQNAARLRQSLQLSQIYKTQLEAEYKKSLEQDQVTKQLLSKFHRQSFYYRELVHDVIRLYCQSKFYNEFTECSKKNIPLLKDDLETVLTKIQATTLFQLDPDLKCSSKPLNIYLDLTDSGDCAGDGPTESECPITFLKNDRSVNFVIDVDEPAFADYERIRIIEMRIVVHGAESSKDELGILLARAGEFSDRYRGKIYSFFGNGKTIAYKYKLSSGEITEFGCMFGENQDELSALPPFTTWTLKISEDASIDLSKVTRVEMKFLTYSSNTKQCDENSDRNAPGSTRVRRSDSGSISPACMRK